MNINDIRLANLRLLVVQFGSPRAVADLSDTSEGYLKEILRGDLLPSGKAKGVGDDLARKLENGCGKDRDWMDAYHGPAIPQPGEPEITPQERELLVRFRRADDQLRNAIMTIARLTK